MHALTHTSTHVAINCDLCCLQTWHLTEVGSTSDLLQPNHFQDKLASDSELGRATMAHAVGTQHESVHAGAGARMQMKNIYNNIVPLCCVGPAHILMVTEPVSTQSYIGELCRGEGSNCKHSPNQSSWSLV